MANNLPDALDGGPARNAAPSELDLFVAAIAGRPIATPAPAEPEESLVSRELRDWLRKVSTRHEEKPSESAVEEFVRAITTCGEGGYDPAKHPRGGFSQNLGWYSPAGEAGAGQSAPARSRPSHNPFSLLGSGTGSGTIRSTADRPSSKPHYPSEPNRPAPGELQTRLAQNQTQKEREEQGKILNSLDKYITPEELAPTPASMIGKREWTSKNGKKFIGTLENISKDGKTVTFKSSDGTKRVDVTVDKLGENDQAIIKGIHAIPKNIVLDTVGLAEKNKQAWIDAVIKDFGALSGLPAGREPLADLTANTRHSVKIRPRSDQDGVGNRVDFNPKPGGAGNVEITYSPTDTLGYKVDGGKGDSSRPPFLALGKELWTGERAAKAGSMPPKMEEERLAAQFENKLRDQYNSQPGEGEKRLRHRDVPEKRPPALSH